MKRNLKTQDKPVKLASAADLSGFEYVYEHVGSATSALTNAKRAIDKAASELEDYAGLLDTSVVEDGIQALEDWSRYIYKNETVLQQLKSDLKRMGGSKSMYITQSRMMAYEEELDEMYSMLDRANIPHQPLSVDWYDAEGVEVIWQEGIHTLEYHVLTFHPDDRRQRGFSLADRDGNEMLSDTTMQNIVRFLEQEYKDFLYRHRGR